MPVPCYSVRSPWTAAPRTILFAVLLLLPSCSALRPKAGDASTRAAAATLPIETDEDRLLGVHAAALAARNYANAHDGNIPTTGQLAEAMGRRLKDFRYVVLQTGLWRDHMERVNGDWPEVLVGEKHGGADGKWAFGFVDGMCSIQSVASYKEMHNSAALNAIPQKDKAP